ncbi:MAG: hypothetical protein HDS67_06485 [Bacteroidales bacterium]|nr:hypothetical protein [Bacteroidales bacterium]MBD5284505.1 hypothetical protein [Bacteroides sp.]
MTTQYDDEATRFDNEEMNRDEDTCFADESQEIRTDSDARSDSAPKEKKGKKGILKRAAAGAGSGLLIGGVATFLMGMTDEASAAGPDNHREELSNPEWVDDQIKVATSVNDDMSFGEAFAAAREEVGPGGCFEWHGQVYGTYTADEWKAMTAEERAEFGDHFSWNHIDQTDSNVAAHATRTASASTPHPTQAEDDIDIVSVTHNNDQNDLTVTDVQPQSEIQPQEAMVVDGTPQAEIEILGVAHDPETGMNMGGMMVDGQEVILIDVDGDMEFDYMGVDTNNDGRLDENEYADIHGQGLGVNDLGGFSTPGADPLASNNSADLTSDIYEG